MVPVLSPTLYYRLVVTEPNGQGYSNTFGGCHARQQRCQKTDRDSDSFSCSSSNKILSLPSPWPLIQKTKTCGLTNRITHHSIAWHSAAQEMASSVRCSPSTPPRPLPSITELRRGRSEPKRSEQSPSTTMELELALPL